MGKRLGCDRCGCANAASHQVGFKVWAYGTNRRGDDNCLRALVGLAVCDEHRADVRIDDILTHGAKEHIAAGVARMGKALPDFASAELEWLPVLDGEMTDPAAFARGET